MAHNDMKMIVASSIEEELGCPVCHTVPRILPIPCCPRGHLVCQSCRGKIRDGNCPTCRLPMGNNVSTVAGALVDKIPHACRFSDLGCEEKDILQHIVEHEKNCPIEERSSARNSDSNGSGSEEIAGGIHSFQRNEPVIHRDDRTIGQQRNLSVKIGSGYMKVVRNGEVTVEMKCTDLQINGHADDVLKLVTKFKPSFGALE